MEWQRHGTIWKFMVVWELLYFGMVWILLSEPPKFDLFIYLLSKIQQAHGFVSLIPYKILASLP